MTRSKVRRFMGIPDEFWIGFVIMVGFFLKIIYDIKLGWMKGTPLIGHWESGSGAAPGHIGLIQYYFTHHFLPRFSSRDLACYSDPPLFYITASLFMELFNRFLGWSTSISLRLVQSMNVIYVLIGQCCSIGIMQKFGVKGRRMLLGLIFIMFFPAFYNIGAAMDGSAMAFMYMMFSLNFSLAWFDSRRAKDLRNAAITAGLALLTKQSSVVILPAIAYLIYKGHSDGRRNETPIAEQTRTFAIIVGIMGLIWPVYQMIRFRMPFLCTDLTAFGDASGSALKRLALPTLSLLGRVHTTGDPLYDSNIAAQTVKTAAADFNAVDISRHGTYAITVFLIYLIIACLVVIHLMFIHTLIEKRDVTVHRRFLVIGELSVMVMYVAGCFINRGIQAMDFKAIAAVLVFPTVGMALFTGEEGSETRYEKVLVTVSTVLILMMAFITAFLYGYYVN